MTVVRKLSGNAVGRSQRRGGFMKASTVLIIMLGLPILVSVMACIGGFIYIRGTLQEQKQQLLAADTVGHRSAAVVDPGLDATGNKYHIIFSTGCSAFQDWQSYVFFYHAWKIQQPGIITRIASGCHGDNQEKLQQIFDKEIKPMAPDRFRIHFTPDYANIKPGIDYKYFNKPFGTKHWMENALGYPNNPMDEDAIVMLFDPDQLILRPFEHNDFSNTEWMYIEKGAKPYSRIEHGKPMGQAYAFGRQWKEKTTMEHVAPNELPSPVDSLTDKQADAGYAVGPPYVATGRDMYAIANKWSQFVPLVHDEYPHLLAEMFGYCLAAAHLKLPHQTAASFMVSSPGISHGEGWKYVDKLEDNELCSSNVDTNRYPSVLHFCQRYSWGPYFFGKHRLPKNFLSCDMPLFKEPPMDLLTQYDHAVNPDSGPEKHRDNENRRNVFAVCHILSALNEAGLYYRQQHCPHGGNQNRTLVFNFGMGDNLMVAGKPRYHPDGAADKE